jgi:hypothetical protein
VLCLDVTRDAHSKIATAIGRVARAAEPEK